MRSTDLQQWFANASVHHGHLEGLVQLMSLDPTPRDADSVGLEQGQRMCASSKFPGDADEADPGNILGELLLDTTNPVNRPASTRLSPSSDSNSLRPQAALSLPHVGCARPVCC